MIFRRVKAHIAKEDWFAVFVDFCIVVIGVFFGMQVQEWYAEQARKVADSQYIQRLHNEAEGLLVIRENVVAPRKKSFDDLNAAIQKVFKDFASDPLTIDECAAMQLSHVYLNPTIDLPTIDELLSAGRLDSLSSINVRNAIVRYTQSAARSNGVIESINTGSILLSRKYPNLIKLDPTRPQNFGLILKSPLPECDLQNMRNNQSFLNDLADNKNRFDAYYGAVLIEPSRQLEALHLALDKELGVSHSPN